MEATVSVCGSKRIGVYFKFNDLKTEREKKMFYGACHLPQLTSRIGPHVRKCNAIDVIHGPGGQYRKKLCPKSWVPPEAVGGTQDRGQFLPIRTDQG